MIEKQIVALRDIEPAETKRIKKKRNKKKLSAITELFY
jgi:hypothetical protein